MTTDVRNVLHLAQRRRREARGRPSPPTRRSRPSALQRNRDDAPPRFGNRKARKQRCDAIRARRRRPPSTMKPPPSKSQVPIAERRRSAHRGGERARVGGEIVELRDPPRDGERELRSGAEPGVLGDRVPESRCARLRALPATRDSAARSPPRDSHPRPPPRRPPRARPRAASEGSNTPAPMPPKRRPSEPRRSSMPKCSRAGASMRTMRSTRRQPPAPCATRSSASLFSM